MTNDALLPCPFCGKTPEITSGLFQPSGRLYGLLCKCDVYFDCRKPSEAEAIAAWNTRSDALLCGDGFVYHSPDSGWEYAADHPIDSGECPDATDVRRSTEQEDFLHEEWLAASATRAHPQADAPALATMREALTDAQSTLEAVRDIPPNDATRIFVDASLKKIDDALSGAVAALPPGDEAGLVKRLRERWANAEFGVFHDAIAALEAKDATIARADKAEAALRELQGMFDREWNPLEAWQAARPIVREGLALPGSAPKAPESGEKETGNG